MKCWYLAKAVSNGIQWIDSEPRARAKAKGRPHLPRLGSHARAEEGIHEARHIVSMDVRPVCLCIHRPCKGGLRGCI